MNHPVDIPLLAVIVNYRTAELAIDCLSSLTDEVASLPGLRAVVVDNASGDDSVERLKAAVAEWPWASVQAVAENNGFSAGNNAAIRPALASPNPPRYVLLLNPDTVVRPGAIAELVSFMESHPQVGLTGPRLEDPDGTPQRSAFRFPTVLGELESGTRLGVVTKLLSRYVIAPPPPDGPCETDWLSGACLLIRREAFDAVGLFDEGYFLYYEEVDFCRRATRAGWPCWYVPSARVVHLVGQTTGWTTKRRRPQYWFASRRRYFRRHLGAARTLAADLAFTAGYASFRLRRPLQGKPDVDPEHLLGDFVRYSIRGEAKNLTPQPPSRNGKGEHGESPFTDYQVLNATVSVAMPTALRGHAAEDMPTQSRGHGTPMGFLFLTVSSRDPESAEGSAFSRLGVVVIGRNEGERLRTCLNSLIGRSIPIVYVDSGSTDGSVTLARSLGAEVVELDMATPFTSGRARNAGLDRLMKENPETEFVQFMDGDCELSPGWLEAAISAIQKQPKTAVVFGRLRERHPEASVYNRMCDLEWNTTPVGEARSCGGISLMRVAAFKQVNGFDPNVLAAEDDELCLRLRRADYSLQRIDADMAWHDAAITRFGQWWTRSIRCGWAYAQGAALHGRSPERHFVHERRRAIIWAGVLPILILGLAWPTSGWSLLGLLLYPYSTVRFFQYMRGRGATRHDASAYAVACTLAKFPQLVGILRYYFRRGPLRLIEYK